MRNIVKTQAVVIKSIKYGDSSFIIRLLTKDYGIKSYIAKGVFNKNSKVKVAYFQPMTIIDIIASQSGGELDLIKEVSLTYQFKSIPFHINKNTIVLFMSELLYKSIIESETDHDLFDFVTSFVISLDEMEEGYNNYPLCFSVLLTRYLGCFPNMQHYSKGLLFDIDEGCFRNENTRMINFLNAEQSMILYDICCGTIQFSVNKKDRRELMDGIMKYYKAHVAGFKDINSHNILRTVLDT